MDKATRLNLVKSGWQVHGKSSKHKPHTTKKIDPRLENFYEYYFNPLSPSFLKESLSRYRAGYRPPMYVRKYGNPKIEN